MLQDHPGDLNFVTDAWTSPNHKAFIAITIHFKSKGVPISMLLDMVEVAESHSGLTLVRMFSQVLDEDEFGISKKVHSNNV